MADDNLFVTWDKDDAAGMARAVATTSAALARAEPVVRNQGSNLYLNVAPRGVSVRDGYGRRDRDDFYEDERLPKKPKDVIRACMCAYEDVGILRQVVDLMADFACQGVDLVHPNERIEKFYKEWFRRANGKDRSERFLNLLYRAGNVIVRRRTAKVNVKTEQEMRRARGEPETTAESPNKVGHREVPWRYTFFSPLTIEAATDELALFAGEDNFVLSVKVPKALIQRVKNPKNAREVELVKKIPPDVVKAIRSGADTVPLDPSKVRAFYYKRDDWSAWASPMARSILSDLQGLQKLKLADLAALDGAISCIRVWKLGNIEARLFPTATAVNRLAEMLCNNVGGGVMDLIWGPELELVETSTNAHHFLGKEKYEPTLTAIYAGLGIPPSLTGASTQSGMTNNFISLQTLVERLEYGRDRLREFWQEEVRLVQQAMGFRFPATLTFDHMSLTDEVTRLNLLINLADRDLISVEALQEAFGLTPEIEEVRLRREARRRENKMAPQKAGPFHSSDKQHELKKLFVPTGTVTPSEVGVELDERKPGEKPPAEMQAELNPKPAPGGGPKGQPGQGRPKQAKDGSKRKRKVVRPRSGASFLRTFAWAEQAQSAVRSIAAPAYLGALGKQTLRELTDAEARHFEAYVFRALCQHQPFTDVTADSVKALAGVDLRLPEQLASLLKAVSTKHAADHGKPPTMDEARRYQAGAYACWKCEE